MHSCTKTFRLALLSTLTYWIPHVSSHQDFRQSPVGKPFRHSSLSILVVGRVARYNNIDVSIHAQEKLISLKSAYSGLNAASVHG
ncbi:hypothetical protein J3E72DRAFT_299453 [Bipolaris maydis]|uniref:uncharacterized protein n=1 Tax=Cochliobolus heterostrophus TaxID=5016 RepID=UPI0024D883A8|nr:hypothetical protein J3E73DRAFT_277846 [Bipolaris maydis]KAJ5065564.1 hypothetical protein J3E74DRAFT_303091 [Bipolaris maydis]KAJ6200771.1 hypothetical protein J3E72DRAFT_299453 [Bipolaris maydis]KAJ6213380.1 hypothetical protein PSV09DRAFT_2276443 [Bipolaris maydis]KAJ6274609.1 hypothetical protein PSV08DRAFT_265792 [Bipolaris maydis]